ncbi:olfactory receptor 5AP2-like [Pleurodeles waltl]|uniref:olfactory receptor 5AP2-like n=1 Tax=Pleurodeles waltl TaxID=8319 RepID=UPI0037094194
MEMNTTFVAEFTLLGLTNEYALQAPLFAFFLLVYIVTLMDNIGIMALIRITPHLHSPMYFLLFHLSLVDLCYSSVITPNMLANFLSERKAISYYGCAVQLFFFIDLGATDGLLLAAMAYDRYVAICCPLLYHTIMSKRCCYLLVSIAHMGGFVQSLIQTGCTFRLHFCNSHQLNHFMCDILPLLQLSCTKTLINEIVLLIFGSITSAGSLLVVLVSYFYIITSVLRISSAVGRQKTFTTCASHFVCVIVFYGTVLFMYLRPRSSYSLDQDRVASIFYTVIIPMLNPLIYSFRNKDVKGALTKAMGRHVKST